MISLRKEFKNIISKNAEWQNVIIRHMSSNRCTCITQEPMIYDSSKKATVPNPSFRTTPNPACPICGGSGYLFEEFLNKGMIFFPGFRFSHFEDSTMAVTEENILTVYIEASQIALDNTYANDWLFFIASELNGKIKQPIIRTKKWIINEVQPIRLDSNKLEYIKIYAKPAIL